MPDNPFPAFLELPGTGVLSGTPVYVAYNADWYPVIAAALQYLKSPVFWLEPPSDLPQQMDTLLEELITPVSISQGAMLLGGAGKVVAGNVMSFAVDTSSVLNGAWLQSTAANNDEIEYWFPLDAGSYDFHRVHDKASDSGKIDWYLDGTLIVSGQDLYNATTVRNDDVSTTVTVTGTGGHILQALINGKNASSSGFRRRTHFLYFVPH